MLRIAKIDRCDCMQIWELMQSDVAPMMVLQLLKSLAGVGLESASPVGSTRSGPNEPGA